MDMLLTSTNTGTHLLDIDYDVYAKGEATLGWLNTTVQFKGNDIRWNEFTAQFLNRLTQRFQAEHSSI